MKIYIKRFNKNIELPTIISKGDWIDLRSSDYVEMEAPKVSGLNRKTKNGVVERFREVEFDTKLINLGVGMILPKGFEAVVLPRSGTFKNFGIILANSEGVIDNSYNGNLDEWKFNAIALRKSIINKNDRICQFRIQLSQKATMWQKIKWLFSSKIELVEVDNLGKKSRGGHGTTGVK